MKFATAFIVSVLTSSVYGLGPAVNVRENVDIEARQTCGDRGFAVPFRRAYSPLQVDHFYTINAQEFRKAVNRLGYSDEGTAGYIYPHKKENTVPLYRLYSDSAGDHLYTTDAKEKNNAPQNGYLYEGVAGYVYGPTNQCCDSQPLYRLYSSIGKDHLYTVSADERDSARDYLGYTYEGIAAYIFPPEQLLF